MARDLLSFSVLMKKVLCSVLLIVTGCLVQSASAALSLSFTQSGSSVLVTASGNVNISGLTFAGESTVEMARIQTTPLQAISSYKANDDYYTVMSSASLFSETFNNKVGSSSGNSFGIEILFGNLYFYVPDGFTSGELNGTLTVPDTELSSLGVIDQTISWGLGSDQAVTLSAVPVPEISTTALLMGMAGLVGVALYRRKKRVVAAVC